MQYYSRRPYNKKKSRSFRWLFVLLPVIIIGGVLYWFLAGGGKAEAPSEADSQTEQQAADEQAPNYTAVELQPTIDAWAARQAADYYIVVYDAQANKNIAVSTPDTSLFAASLYKIFVSYFALQDFQTGAQDPSDILISGQTKKQCVDKMIRSSDSPCGEAMMAEIGQSNLNKRAIALGTTGTFFNGIRTSARDTALILQYIDEQRDLTPENTAFLRDAMLTQDAKYKRGLQSGAPQAKWETKVGWNEDENYHDIGIMTMPDGRVFYVSIMGQGSGSSAPIADFSKTIYAALTL